MIYSDGYRRIAHGKVICQDAVHFGSKNGVHFATLGDGCSTAQQSEHGAELLSRTMGEYINRHNSLLQSSLFACGHANAVRKAMGMPASVMHSTLLAVSHTGLAFHALVFGDGYIVQRHRGCNAFRISEFSHTANLPCYPWYFANDDMDHYRVRREELNDSRHTTNMSIDVEGAFLRHDPDEIECFSPVHLLDSRCTYCEWTISSITHDMTLVFSDGLNSFVDSSGSPVPIEQVLRVFLNFKSLQGAFLQRRMDVAFRKVAELGWKNVDDFSVAGICEVS